MYHITAKGEFALCRATKGKCPLGGPHGSKEELEQALAQSYQGIPRNKRKSYELPTSEPVPDSWSQDDRDFWLPVKEHLGLFIHQEKPYALGDPEKSTFYCFDCYTRMPKDSYLSTPNWETTCTGCGGKLMDGLTGVALSPSSEKFFHKEAVLESDWYHYSVYEEWESLTNPENADAKVIHLGSREAALDRELHTSRKGGKLYRVRLKPEAQVADQILEEDPFNEEEAPLVDEGGSPRGVYVAGVTRYLNYYEDPGSISLMVNPRLIEIVEVSPGESSHEVQ